MKSKGQIGLIIAIFGIVAIVGGLIFASSATANSTNGIIFGAMLMLVGFAGIIILTKLGG